MSCRRLEGKSALITGGASGVGRATAKRFAEEGASVLCLFDRDPDNLQAVCDEVEQRGAKALPFVGDVTSVEDCQAAVDLTVSTAGRLDVLVSNAGADAVTPFLEIDLEEWERILSVNLTAAFVLGQRAARAMVADGGGGCILYTASVCGIMASLGDAHYGVAKAGIISLVKTMAHELVGHNIRVNAVSPGPLDTPMSLALLGSEEAMQEAREHFPACPMDRLGLPEEIAAAYAYLASSDGAYTTAQNLVVDGGMTAGAFPLPEE